MYVITVHPCLRGCGPSVEWTGVCTVHTDEKVQMSLIIQDDLLELCIKFHSVKV